MGLQGCWIFCYYTTITLLLLLLHLLQLLLLLNKVLHATTHNYSTTGTTVLLRSTDWFHRYDWVVEGDDCVGGQTNPVILRVYIMSSGGVGGYNYLSLDLFSVLYRSEGVFLTVQDLRIPNTCPNGFAVAGLWDILSPP